MKERVMQARDMYRAAKQAAGEVIYIFNAKNTSSNIGNNPERRRTYVGSRKNLKRMQVRGHV